MPKTTVFFRGREILDPHAFAEYLPPQSSELQMTSDSPLAYHPADAATPGYPANPRMLLARLYLQLGNFLDMYTGQCGLSLQLREAIACNSTGRPSGVGRINDKDLSLFPQFCVSPSWPPCFLIHGADDTAVPVAESRHMQQLLESNQVPVTVKIVPNREHSFDYAEDAIVSFGGPSGLFDEVKDFILSHLSS